MSTLNNTYTPSKLIANDFVGFLGNLDSVFLKYTGSERLKMFFNEKHYVPGEKVGFKLLGYPSMNRGKIVKFGEFEERSMFFTADEKRWLFSITRSFNFTDSLFYTNPKIMAQEVSGPIIRKLKDEIEREACQYGMEHAPIIPSFDTPINQEIALPLKLNVNTVAQLEKLRCDLIFNQGYTLFLNTKDRLRLSNSIMRAFNEDMIKQSVTKGEPPKQLSGFPTYVSPILQLHKSRLGASQARGPLRFVTLPTSDERTTAIIKNMSGSEITLSAADIIHHVASDTQEASGLYWVQGSFKTPIRDSRYAFCITSDKYIEGTTDQNISPFPYDEVAYTIPNGGTAEVSLSHRPISTGAHQNCSRDIALGDSGDTFYILQDHYKNVALHPNFFQFACFKPKPLHNKEHHYSMDSKTGIKLLTTQDSQLVEGTSRSNILDVLSFPTFGAIGEGNFTFPTNPNAKGELDDGIKTNVSLSSFEGLQQTLEKFNAKAEGKGCKSKKS